MPNVRQRDSKGDTSCLLDLAKKYYDRCYREKKAICTNLHHYWKASSEINFVFQWKSNGLALVFCILQYLAMTWYV